MKLLSKVTLLGSAVLMLAVLPARAQQTDAEPAGITWGDYITHQSVEFGYRDSLINGNLNSYQTFENLGSGVRLFDYTLEMRSLDHNGLLFDNLSFSNFGYGGDPNNVTRLRIEKNKWYDFRGVFRRDENFWNYNLLANPLNPASSNPAVPIVNSPHALDLVRRMQDYDLTLLPQSRLRFRLGYSRNVNEGPGFTTLDGGTEPVLAENFKFTTNAYRAGVDFRFLPKTTISFDELLTYFKQDSGVTDQNFPFVLSNGTPADLGIVFNTVGKTPCQMPILSPTTPPTANPNCNGFLAYSRVGSPRGFFPTERVAFQSNYFKNLAMSGSLGYSRDDSSVPNFNEFMNSWTSRSGSRGGTVGGPSDAKRLSINVDWAGDYRVTDKFHIVDEFRWDKWSNPGVWDTAETSFFPTLPTSPGQVGLLLPIAQVNPATFSTVCPAPFTAVACPQHMPTSGADITNELVSQFLGQNLKTNTFELEYQLTTRVNARVGYLYTDRSISDFSATVDTGETYFPGGPGGNAGNFFLAARGDCAGGPGVNGCVLNSDGSITEGSLARPLPESGNDSSRNYYHIHEYAFLAGLTLRPMDKLRVSAAPTTTRLPASAPARCRPIRSMRPILPCAGPVLTAPSTSTKTATTSPPSTISSTAAPTALSPPSPRARACGSISDTITRTSSPRPKSVLPIPARPSLPRRAPSRVPPVLWVLSPSTSPPTTSLSPTSCGSPLSASPRPSDMPEASSAATLFSSISSSPLARSISII